MTVTARDSTFYTNYDVNKYNADSRDRGGQMIPLLFAHATVVESGASADTVNLCVIPANHRVIDLFIQSDAVGGASTTIKLGDSVDDDRYLLALDVSATLAVRNSVPYTAYQYTPTADTIVKGTWGTASTTTGKNIKGHFVLVR